MKTTVLCTAFVFLGCAEADDPIDSDDPDPSGPAYPAAAADGEARCGGEPQVRWERTGSSGWVRGRTFHGDHGFHFLPDRATVDERDWSLVRFSLDDRDDVTVLAGGIPLGARLQVGDGVVYWIDETGGAIRAAHVDGGGHWLLRKGEDMRALRLHEGELFWAMRYTAADGVSSGALWKLDLDTLATTRLADVEPYVRELEIDGDRLFASGAYGIYWLPRAGGGTSTRLAEIDDVYDLAVSGDRVYWSEAYVVRAIDKDGGGPAETIAEIDGYVIHELLPVGDEIWFAQGNGDKGNATSAIYRVPAAGGDVVQVFAGDVPVIPFLGEHGGCVRWFDYRRLWQMSP